MQRGGQMSYSVWLLEDLAKSGLTPDDIPGIIEEPDGYWIPYLDPITGEFMTDPHGKPFRRKKLKIPLGKQKYTQEPGSGLRLFITQKSHVLILETKLLWMTEGEKKAASGAKHNLPVIGIAGINSWCDSKADRNEHDILNRDLLPYITTHKIKLITLIFDSDGNEPRKKHNFDLAAKKFAIELDKYECTLRFATLPELDGEKTGLDDFLLKRGVDELVKFEMKNAVKDPHKIKFSFINGKDLMMKETQPCNWFVQDILPEGFTLIVGRSKAGKSYLSLALIRAIATGDKALGTFNTFRNNCIYFSFEDSERQTKERYKDKLKLDIPENIKFCWELPTIDRQACIIAIDELLEQNPTFKVVVIDTIGQIRPPKNKNQGGTLYDDDTCFYSKFREIAHRHRAAIIGLHHTNKLKNVCDPFESVSGSMGTQGAADTLWLVHDPSNGQDFNRTLHIRGKDIDSHAYALRSVENYQWACDGNARELETNQERREIIEFLKNAGKSLKPDEIAREIGKQGSSVRHLCRALLEEGLIVQPSYGLYAINKYTHS